MIKRINERIRRELISRKITEEKMRLHGYASYLPNGDANTSAVFVMQDGGDNLLFMPDDRFDFMLCHVRKSGRKVDDFGRFEHEIDLLVIADPNTIGWVLKAFKKENEYHEKSYDADTQRVTRNYLRYVTDNPDVSCYVIKYSIITDEDIFAGENAGNCC